LPQPISWGAVKDERKVCPLFQKAQGVIRKRKHDANKKKEAESDGVNHAPKKKRKVPPKFCPRVKETKGVNARTQWLEAFKSLPGNTLVKAIVVLEPHVKHEGTRDNDDDTSDDDEQSDEPEEDKPPHHIHAFVWYQKPTDLLRALIHFNSCMPGYMERSRDCGTGLKGTLKFDETKEE
jgi:hypothetical protein